MRGRGSQAMCHSENLVTVQPYLRVRHMGRRGLRLPIWRASLRLIMVQIEAGGRIGSFVKP